MGESGGGTSREWKPANSFAVSVCTGARGEHGIWRGADPKGTVGVRISRSQRDESFTERSGMRDGGSGILPKPTWVRLGMANPPDERISGKDVGVVVLDRLRPHSTLRHLGHRLVYVVVNDDLSVTCRNIACESPCDDYGDFGEHGLKSVLLLSHLPFELEGEEYSGIAPAAKYIVLDYGPFRDGERERLTRGVDWILERRDEWNIRIILTPRWNEYGSAGWMENTDRHPFVQGLASAIEAGLLVIASNGNTRFENESPPTEYFAVGRFDGQTFSDLDACLPYPDEPWGRNGDGHARPDILAPGLYLPVPYCETAEVPGRLSYFGQTSGAATLLAGLCVHILSLYPDLESATLRQALVEFGDNIQGYDNPAPRVNAAKAIQAIAEGYRSSKSPAYPPPIRVTNPRISLDSDDPIERGLALTMLARDGQCDREELWEYVDDELPTVRKVAVWALQRPNSPDERWSFWAHLNKEPECGVRGYWAYGLLHDSKRDELDLWMPWIDDANWAVRWCVSEFLKKYCEFPSLEKTFDPELIQKKALPALKWYRDHRDDANNAPQTRHHPV